MNPAPRQVEVRLAVVGVKRPVDLCLDLGPDVHVARFEFDPIAIALDLVASGLRPGGNQTTRARAKPEDAYSAVKLQGSSPPLSAAMDDSTMLGLTASPPLLQWT